MNSLTYSTPEALESRIAPAGLITSTFVHGVLTLAGADNADHTVSIVKTGPGLFVVTGSATDVNLSGHSSQNYHGTLKSVVIDGGSGVEDFTLTNLPALKSLQFNGNAGSDSLAVSNLRTQLGGHVTIDLGSETGSVDFTGTHTSIHGPLSIDLGGGGAAGFHAATTTVDGLVAITGGAGNDSVTLNGPVTLFKNKLTFTGGAGNDSFNSSGKSLTVQGGVTMDGGTGTNNFAFSADHTALGKNSAAGLVSLSIGGTGALTFTGKSTAVLGGLTVDLGTSGGALHLDSLATSVHNSVQVSGGAGNDTLEMAGQVGIGKALSFVGNGGIDSFTASGSRLTVKGATSMDGSAGVNSFDLHPTHLALASVTFTGGPSNDTVSIIADGIIAGNVSLQLGPDGIGPSSTTLQSNAGVANGLKLGGSLAVNMPGATVDFLTVTNVQVAKGFTALTGDDVSTVNIAALNDLGNFSLQTGAGADVVNLDNINAHNFMVDTGVGADVLHIERNSSYTGPSKITGDATILTGIGADEIRIGDSSDSANLKVLFKGTTTIDAGDGANMINDVLASNSFHTAPSILATGGVLTQTTAP